MFPIELELISVVADPKGGNRVLSIRVRGRYTFDVFLTSNETRFSLKMLGFQLNLSSSPLWRTRREETKRSLYQNPGSIHFDVFLTSN